VAHIIPNATDTGSALRFANINQAEPDALDIEALGNRSNFIRSGGVTTQSGGTINVTGGVAVIAGVPYSFSTYSVVNAAPDTVPSNVQFSLLVARLSGSTVSIVKLDGVSSSTNPVFPKSLSTAHSSDSVPQQNNYFNPDTDALICAIFRAAAGSTVDGHLIDKRTMYTGNITWTQAAVPSAGQGINGDVVILASPTSTTNAVYVRAAGNWLQVASQSVVDDIVPVGMVVTWPANTTPPARFKECNGTALPNDPLYDGLATAWGVSQPITLPDYSNQFLRGGAATGGSGLVTASGGADSVTIPLLAHVHDLSNHVHTLPAHGHGTVSTGAGGGHGHSGALNSTAITTNIYGHGHAVHPVGFNTFEYNSYGFVSVRRPTPQYPQPGGLTWQVTGTFPFTSTTVPSDYALQLMQLGGGGSPLDYAEQDSLVALNDNHSHTGSVTNGAVTVNAVGDHTHTVTVNNASLTTNAPSTNSTSSTGSVSPTIDNRPAFKTIRYFVRAY
jgi:hypothetical protein